MSGKSLLLSLLSGQVKPSGGTIFFNGNESGKIFFKRSVSIYPHNGSLRDDTPVEQVRRGKNGITSAFVEKNLSLFFRDTDHPAYVLSGSLRCIADIMQAASSAGEVLLLDSPDNGLDPRQISLLSSFIREYNITLHKNILIASYNLNFLSECCSTIVFLSNNRSLYQIEPISVTEEIISEVFGMSVSIADDLMTGNPRFTFSYPV